MSIQTSKTILKVFGIIGIIFGGLTSFVSIFLLLGGGVVSLGNGDESYAVGALILILGILTLISGLITLAQGICSYNASKDSSKIKPAWIFAIIGMVANGITLISSISNDSGVFSAIISLGISVVLFVAANTIKKND